MTYQSFTFPPISWIATKRIFSVEPEANSSGEFNSLLTSGRFLFVAIENV